ncbi:MAG TPA: NlpC/P60 family protein, partial [Kineosporiaceae bacterium]|nr:NlpC/P60 family protein [Kineosporiaceae bacterium]
MARYTAVQIYAFARAAGFDPDQSVTMTAIALAESGGRSSAHATVGEDSRGLWQINAAAHPEFSGMDLYDPKANAAAAFAVSRGGADVSPWTTTHGGGRASYLRFRSQAQAAAVTYGEPSADGAWDGTAGYGHRLPAGRGHGDDSAAGGAGIGVPASNPAPATDSTPHLPPSELPPEQRHGVAFVPATDPGPGGGVADPSDAPGRVAAGGQVVAGEQVVAGDLPAAGGDPAVPVADLPPEQRHGVVFVQDPAAADGSSGGTVPGLGAAPDGQGIAGGDAAHPAALTRGALFVEEAMAQRGDRYVMGATAKVSDPHPAAFDCSELVHWAAARAGIEIPDGALPQFLDLQERGLEVDVERAIHTPGALLFSFASPPGAHDMRPAAAHVAISRGDGTTIEARGRAYGVDVFDATTKRFHYAALLPQAEELIPAGDPAPAAVAHAAAVPSPAAAVTSVVTLADARSVTTGGGLLDTDGDGLPDRQEERLGLDPYLADTDHDLYSDSYELLFGHADLSDRLPSGLAWNGSADAVLLGGDTAAPGSPAGTVAADAGHGDLAPGPAGAGAAGPGTGGSGA